MESGDSASTGSLSDENGPSLLRRIFRSRKLEKAPLLSQRRLFHSLSGRSNVQNGEIAEENVSDSHRTLGTFAGVFAPVCLSQFSTLLFLRIGFIIGSLGFLVSFGTLSLVYIILLFTILSICAISTNGAIEGGGPYFMISRTLGPEFGGAIGALFFLANVFSSALYTTGCVEGIVQSFGVGAGKFAIYRFLPEGDWYNFGYGSALNVLNILVCFIGAGMFAKTTVVILFVVIICTSSAIISFLAIPGVIEVPIPGNNEIHPNTTGQYTGLSTSTFQENLYPFFVVDYTTGNEVDFATVFSVLFTGVTGIMAGANMSGELIKPSRNIPLGTLLSCVFTYCIYFVLFILCAATCSRFLLQNNYSFMAAINIWPPFVAVGVFTATFSASLSNIIGASRVLAALIKDNIYGGALRWIGHVSYHGNPLGAILLSGLMVECVLVVGELNTIALFTSVFFLLSYMATNIACLSLEWASAPNFRPTFRYFSWWTASLGILSNVVMMFIISPVYSALCIIFCLILIIILHLRSPIDHKWGSISQALIFHQVRKYLLLLDNRKDHVKFWRPQVLLLVANPRSACPLIDFVNDLKKSGLYILGHVQVQEYCGDGPDPASLDFPKWQCLVDHLKVKAFVEVTVSNSVRAGMQQMVRIAGLGAMKPNTVVLGFNDDAPPQDFFTRNTSAYSVPPIDSTSRSRSCEIAKFLLDWQNEFCQESGRLKSSEYVAMIKDILNMGKNVCLGRHFHLLDKEAILKKRPRELPYIDVWPMNFVCPDEKNVFDTSSLFIMQLATILNMVSSWRKKTQLRVFLCVSSATTDPERQKQQVWHMLRELRIEATIVIVPWTPIASLWKNEYAEKSESSSSVPDYIPTRSDDAVNSFRTRPSEDYLTAVNQMIRENSINTAVSFLYLPYPPLHPSLYSDYLDSLTTLTNHLHPTLLIHGVSAVTTTNL